MRDYRAPRPLDPALRARVLVGADSASLSFEVLRGDAVLATRTFTSLPARCPERVRAVGIALALAFESVQEEAERQSAQAASAPSAAPAPPSGLAPPAPAAAAEPAERAADLELALLAGTGVLIEVLPEAAWTLGLGASLGVSGALRLELRALASPGVSSPLAGGVADSQLVAGQAGLCLGERLGALRAAACGGVASGVALAQGRDFAVRSRSASAGWLAAALTAQLDWYLAPRVALRASVDAYGSLVRPSLEARIAGSRRRAEALPLGAQLSAHVLWALP